MIERLDYGDGTAALFQGRAYLLEKGESMVDSRSLPLHCMSRPFGGLAVPNVGKQPLQGRKRTQDDMIRDCQGPESFQICDVQGRNCFPRATGVAFDRRRMVARLR